MAIIPLKDEIKIHRAVLDEWGIVNVSPEPIIVKCRFDESFEVIVDKNGESVTSKGTIHLDSSTEIRYDDLIEWVDGNGDIHKQCPRTIQTLKSIVGKVILKKVVV